MNFLVPKGKNLGHCQMIDALPTVKNQRVPKKKKTALK